MIASKPKALGEQQKYRKQGCPRPQQKDTVDVYHGYVLVDKFPYGAGTRCTTVLETGAYMS